MMKLDSNFKRKIGTRSSNAVLAFIFLAGIIVGIMVTVLAIVSLPDGSPGNVVLKPSKCYIRLIPENLSYRFKGVKTSTTQQIGEIF